MCKSGDLSEWVKWYQIKTIALLVHAKGRSWRQESCLQDMEDRKKKSFHAQEPKVTHPPTGFTSVI